MSRGISLLEVLVVVGILGLLALGISTAAPTFRKRSDLNAGVETVASLLTDARVRTLSSEENSRFGVYFQADRAVLFSGGYATNTPGNIVQFLPNSIQISSIALESGTTSVVFKRLTGDTDQYGTIVLKVREGLSASTTITIGQRGTIEVNK